MSEGNGFDDNFGLQSNSPAIDRADGPSASTLDAIGRTRRDDPSVGNVGGGVPNFVDIGALEFQGDSSDVTPPTLTSISPSGIFAATSISSVDSIVLRFNEPIDAISATSRGLYRFVADGIDNQFDTGDDIVIQIISFAYQPNSLDLQLTFSQPLTAERYRFSVLSRAGQAIFDQAGNALDGDANGTSGGDFVRFFNVANVVGPVTDIHPAANSVAENASSGTTVGLIANATDPDVGSVITYSLDSDAGGRFAINTSSGEVRVALGTLLDAESSTTHQIVVRATSSDGSFSTALFNIAVLDVNEFDITVPVDTNPLSNTVNENAPQGTLVGLTATSIDPDQSNNAIHYSLDNDANGRFGIEPLSGVVFGLWIFAQSRSISLAFDRGSRHLDRWFFPHANICHRGQRCR